MLPYSIFPTPYSLTFMTSLVELYVKLVGLALIGFILGRKLPATVPTRLGQWLFWVGVPASIIAFLRRTDLSGQIWVAPAIAFSAIFFGAVLALTAIQLITPLHHKITQKSTQGSLILAAMVGNTGYIGYPVILSLVGDKYFAWALFYDLLGTTLGAYGFGVALASQFGDGIQSHRRTIKAILINPALWSFGIGLLMREVTLPDVVVTCLDTVAWSAIASSLILIGMRLSKLTTWGSFKLATISLTIKMILVPLILGLSLAKFGINGKIAQVIVLQMAMPPAFATLVLAEAFNLDKDLAVTTLAAGSLLLLITLPFWLWFF
jgi:malate permease and related proteins